MATTSTSTSALPETESTLLKQLRDERDLPALRHRVHSLRQAGWTLAQIGEPLSARRSTVRSWENHPDASQPAPIQLPPTPLPERQLAALLSFPASTSRLTPAPTPSEAALLARLAPLAARVRANTPASSHLAQARDELNALVLTLHLRGVSTNLIAHHAGVTYRSMRNRVLAVTSAPTPTPAAPTAPTAA